MALYTGDSVESTQTNMLELAKALLPIIRRRNSETSREMSYGEIKAHWKQWVLSDIDNVQSAGKISSPSSTIESYRYREKLYMVSE